MNFLLKKKTKSQIPLEKRLTRNNLGQMAISFLRPFIWNKLSNVLKNSKTTTSFTQDYKKLVLENLSEQNIVLIITFITAIIIILIIIIIATITVINFDFSIYEFHRNFVFSIMFFFVLHTYICIKMHTYMLPYGKTCASKK